jgi:hypothetical protein
LERILFLLCARFVPICSVPQSKYLDSSPFVCIYLAEFVLICVWSIAHAVLCLRQMFRSFTGVVTRAVRSHSHFTVSNRFISSNRAVTAATLSPGRNPPSKANAVTAASAGIQRKSSTASGTAAAATSSEPESETSAIVEPEAEAEADAEVDAEVEAEIEAASIESKWYATTPEGGLKFGCTACGKCCTGKGGIVRVNEQEILALAKLKDMTYQVCSRLCAVAPRRAYCNLSSNHSIRSITARIV